MDKLYIVMPAYNEQDNIRTVVAEWYPLLNGKDKDSKLVVADSGSVDATHEILLELRKKYPQLVILSETKQQHGPKVMALYNYAIKEGADFIFQTDSDGQTLPEEFAAFWNLRAEKDAIIGNRIIREDGYIRKLIEKIVCLLLWLFFGVKIPDANAPFRLMKSSLLQKYIAVLPSDYNLPNIMITAFFVYYHENIQFMDISFKKRQGGKNSVNIFKIIIIGLNAIKNFYGFRKKMLKKGN